MCGIAGAYDLHGRRLFPRELLLRMAARLSHRGPDAQGFYAEPGYSAAVNRLILRDAELGAQPMQDAESCISLNGELFSFHKDKKRLSAAGVDFRTNCDTEVFLKGLGREGASFLKQADAQYALAFYQKDSHELWLARDRSGIVPLFYAQQDGWLLFASEIKALFASGMLKPRLNPVSIDRFLTTLALAPTETCFAGAETIAPGQLLTVRAGRIHASPHPERHEISHNADLKAPIEELESLLFDSVQRRLEADARVGVYLSGGVDSSLIAALAAKAVPQERRDDLTAYSISLGGPGDESHYARKTAKALGLRHVVLEVSPPEIVSNFVRAVRAAEVPLLDHASVCLMLLAERVRADGRKAVLTGEGADEAFAGYPWHRTGFLGRLTASLFELFSSQLTVKLNAPFRHTNQYALFSALAGVRGLYYSKEFVSVLQGAAAPAFAARTGPGRLANSLALDYEWILAGHLLADKGDRMSMSASIEARYPFLDTGVVDFAQQLSDRWKLRGSRNKWILRKVAERHLGMEAAWRPKHLFRAEPAIHGPLKPQWVDQLLSEESLRETGLFDPVLVRRGTDICRRRLDPRRSIAQVGLSGVVSTQLLHHLFCGTLCDL